MRRREGPTGQWDGGGGRRRCWASLDTVTAGLLVEATGLPHGSSYVSPEHFRGLSLWEGQPRGQLLGEEEENARTFLLSDPEEVEGCDQQSHQQGTNHAHHNEDAPAVIIV